MPGECDCQLSRARRAELPWGRDTEPYQLCFWWKPRAPSQERQACVVVRLIADLHSRTTGVEPVGGMSGWRVTGSSPQQSACASRTVGSIANSADFRLFLF